MEIFISTFLKMFFIFTPFFVLSVFLTLTKDATKSEKKSLAVRVSVSVLIISLILLFFGKHIFHLFGITLDAFRIGAGTLLFLSGVELVRGSKDGTKANDKKLLNELAVVPLAIPITVGPGCIGMLLVLGAAFKDSGSLFLASLGLFCAVVLIGFMLYSSTLIENVLGKQGLTILSKITGIFIAAISAQLIFTGIKNFLGL